MQIRGKRIDSILGKRSIFGKGFELIIIDFKQLKLAMQINQSTDEIVLKYLEKVESKEKLTEILPELKNKIVVAFWSARNDFGYQDLCALATENFSPNVLFNAIGSEIKIQKTESNNREVQKI